MVALDPEAPEKPKLDRSDAEEIRAEHLKEEIVEVARAAPSLVRVPAALTPAASPKPPCF